MAPTTRRSPDDRLDSARIRDDYGIPVKTWNAYRARPGQAPDPDDHEELSGRAWWYRSTIEKWLAERPGRGARTELVRTRRLTPAQEAQALTEACSWCGQPRGKRCVMTSAAARSANAKPTKPRFSASPHGPRLKAAGVVLESETAA